jgi:hypothetical protein
MGTNVIDFLYSQLWSFVYVGLLATELEMKTGYVNWSRYRPVTLASV